MKKLILLSLLLAPAVARAQQTLFVPECSGTDDTAAFATLVSNIGSNVGTISLPYKAGARCAVNSLRIPPNITLDNTQGSGIKVNTGQTLTVAGPISNPPGKELFFNARAGQGTVSFPDNTVVGQVYPQWWGAVADGTTDSTAAIQATMDAAPAGGVVFFPNGSYRISSALTRTKPLILRGAGMTTQDGGATATKLGGSFNDYLVKFPLAGFVGGTGVEDMYLTNTHPTGGGIYLSRGAASTRFQHLQVEAYRALTFTEANFTILVEDVRLKGYTFYDNAAGRHKVPPGGWGIYTRGHTQIVSADIVNFDHGIRVAGAGVSIVGGRYEVNNIGIVLGTLDDGSVYQAANVSISGFAMEANDIGIYLRAAASYTISAFSIQGSTGSPSGQSVFGILSETGSPGVIQSGGPGGSFSKAAIRSRGFCTFIDVGAGNSLGATWDVQSPQSAVFINSDYRAPDGTPIPNMTATQFVRSLGAADQLRGMRQGNNLRGIGVKVAHGASFVDVVFPNHVGGHAQINAASPIADGSSRLAPATYYYNATIVNEVGETTAAVEKSVAVTSGSRVDISFYGVNGINWRRRVYRGTTPGVYDGYFELPLESSGTFTDLGQPFTGRHMPSRNVEGAQGTEPDEVYAVAVMPSWNAGGVWVTNKTKEGFRVNFGTAPGANSTLDWILVR